MSLDQTPITRTYGHGGITLTAYPSSGRVGVEVAAENAVMDYSDLLDFADLIHKPRVIETAAELDALPVGSVVLDAHNVVWQKPYNEDDWCAWLNPGERGVWVAKRGPLTVLHEGSAS